MWAAAEGHADVVKALLDARPIRTARRTSPTLEERKHADHPTGGFTALMFAARNGHEAAIRALIKGGADPKLTNGDGATATIDRHRQRSVRPREDAARPRRRPERRLALLRRRHARRHDRHARARRLAAARRSPQQADALDLIKVLLDRGADPNKAFVGQLHSTTLCCGEEVNSSPFYRAAVAADVEALKLMIAQGRAGRVEPDRGQEGRRAAARPAAAATPTSARRR